MAYTDPYTLGDSYPGPIHESAATMMLRLMMITKKRMSKIERHLRMFEKLGLRSTDLWLNTKTQVTFPENFIFKETLMCAEL